MAAFIGGPTKIGIREYGTKCTIPADPKGKLMYYLDCILGLLDISDSENVARLRDYENYNSLTESEIDQLVALAFVLSPDELSGKIIFCDAGMCGDSNNTFFELSAARSSMMISDSIVIGGQKRSVKKIMAFKRQWLDDNWKTPMSQLSNRLTGRARRSNDCIIS